MRTHSSSRSSVFWRASSAALLVGRGAPASAPASASSCPRTGARAALELEDPLGDVVEEVAVVRDRDDGARVVLQEPLEPATDSASRWFVGSSSSSRSGCWSNSLHSATRRRSPPDSVVTSASSGGQRSASMAISRLRSRSQASAASIRSSSTACSRADLLVVGVGVGPLGHELVVWSMERLDRGDASSTLPLTSLVVVELRLLGEVADVEARRQPGLAGEPVVDAGHDAQQARLARAVGADARRSGAGVERQGDVLRTSGPAGRTGRACSRCR